VVKERVEMAALRTEARTTDVAKIDIAAGVAGLYCGNLSSMRMLFGGDGTVSTIKKQLDNKRVCL